MSFHTIRSYFSIRLVAPPSVVHHLFQKQLKSRELDVTHRRTSLLLTACKSSSFYAFHIELICATPMQEHHSPPGPADATDYILGDNNDV